MNNDRPSVFGDGAGSPDPGRRSDSWNPTLTIQFEDGACTTFLYGQLIWMNFYPSQGVILHFSSHTVWVVGRNLVKLYAELEGLRLRRMVVVSVEHDLGEADTVVVHWVKIGQHTQGEPRSEEFPKGPGRP